MHSKDCSEPLTVRKLKSNTHIKKSLSEAQKSLSLILTETLVNTSLSYFPHLSSFKYHMQVIPILALSPCGAFIASGSADGTIKVSNFQEQNADFILIGSSGSICSIAFSPDGNNLVCGYECNLVEIWNFKQKFLEFSVKGLSNCFQRVAFSPDGKFIAFLARDCIAIWNFIDRKEEFKLYGHRKAVRSIVYSADGRYLVSGSNDKSIIVWNLEEKRQEFRLWGHTQVICAVAVSNNVKLIASASYDKSLFLWSTDRHRFEFSFKFCNIVRCVSFSADDNYLVSGSDDCIIRVWNITTREICFVISTENSRIYSVFFSFDQKTLYAGCSNSKLNIWKIYLKKMRIAPKKILIDVSLIAISRDSKFIALAKLEIWNLKSRKKLYDLGTKSESLITYIEFSINCELLMGADAALLKIWNLKSKELIFSLCGGSNRFHRVNNFKISNDFNFLTVSNDHGIIEVWDTKLDSKIFEIFENNIIEYTAISPGNENIAIVLNRFSIKVWSIVNKCESYCLSGLTVHILFILFSEDGKLIISCSIDCKIIVWNIIEKKIEFTLCGQSKHISYFDVTSKYLISNSHLESQIFWNLEKGRKEFIGTYLPYLKKLSYDNKYIVEIIDNDAYHSVDIWKFQEIREIMTINNESFSYFPIKFSNNEKFAVCGDEKLISLWSVEDNKKILSFLAHKRWVRSIAFSFDSKFIVSGGDDNCVKIWDLQGTEIKCFKGHMDWVMAVAFNIDGELIVSASKDWVLKIWSIVSLNEKASFRGIEETPHTICFSKSGKFVALEFISNLFSVYKY